MLKKILKRMLMISIVGITTLSLSGCGEKIMQFTDTTLNRIEDNRDILTQLHESGFMSDTVYDSYNDHLTEMQTYYRNEAAELSDKIEDANSQEDFDEAIGGGFVSAISKYSYIGGNELLAAGHDTLTGDDGKEIDVEHPDGGGKIVSEFQNIILVNYLGSIDILGHYNDGDSSSNGSCKPSKTYSRSSCEPLELIGNDVASDINARFNCPVYVLNPDMLSSEGVQSLDDVIAAVNGGIHTDESGHTTVDVAVLDRYFSPAKDSNGNNVTLLSELEGFELVIESRDQELTGTKVQPGYDSVISQHDVPCFTIKYREFDLEAFQKLRDLIGLNERQYVYSPENGGRMYLLEYPVSYLDRLYNSTDDTVIGSFSESGLGVNLYTKTIIKYEPQFNSYGALTGWSNDGTPISNLNDSYLTLDGAPNSSYEGQSAFVINGSTTVDVSFNLRSDTVNTTLTTARIILRDYLEATYAPEMVDNEDLVVVGRKIRIDFYEFNDAGNAVWHKNDYMAYYVDKDGIIINNGLRLKPTDFCNAESLLAEDPFVKRLGFVGETSNVSIPAKTVPDGTLMTISDLKETRIGGASNSIVPTLMFPGTKLGAVDFGDNGANDSNNKQRFYAIATSKGIFDSGLYNNWINIANTEASLDWWNTYLSENNYAYSVAHQDVNDYLLGNFGYELSQTGVVILDLDVVHFIQEEMDEEAETERTELIRTIFIVLGWFLIFYSLFLMLAWIIDTNSDIGIDLLTKLTMGNWIAIKYPEDIPGGDLSNTKYISASGITLSCIIIIAVGILIINVDIIKLVMLLINTFGSIAGEIEKMLKGFR